MAPICKYCDAPATVYTYPNGHGPTYGKTCGSHPCRYRANVQRVRTNHKYPKICRHCNTEYVAVTPTSRYCKACVPTKSAAGRLQRYGIPHWQFVALLEKQGNKCAICDELDPQMLDHDHTTNEIRGVLCVHCNLGVAWLENQEWRPKAEVYLGQLVSAMKGLSA